jgi:CheY-like chemotaxis protein
MSARQPPAHFTSPSNPIVLCIDDQAEGLIIRKLFLESMGYEVLTASSGRAGLDVVAKHQVDAVVLDYRMPEMDGEAVATELRRRRPDLPIVLLSGYVPELPAHVRHLVNAFVSKGSPPGELVAALEATLGRSPKKPPVSAPSILVKRAHQQLEHSRALAARTRHQLKNFGKKKN